MAVLAVAEVANIIVNTATFLYSFTCTYNMNPISVFFWPVPMYIDPCSLVPGAWNAIYPGQLIDFNVAYLFEASNFTLQLPTCY